MKKIFKGIVVSILNRQVKKLTKKHDIKVVAVVGSIGKTSTKLAIAQTLEKSLKVRYQNGNYNDVVTVPLVFFGHETPSLLNPFAWIKIFASNSKQIKSKYPYDVVVLELGTDFPGNIKLFEKCVSPDISIVTAISEEHMEFFDGLDQVAEEELSVVQFSKQIVYNLDLVDEKYRANLPDDSISYSFSSTEANYHLANVFHSANGYEGDVKQGKDIVLHVSQEVVSETQLYSLLAAVITGRLLGLKNTQILDGIASIKPVSGRLRRLRGINNSIIIDDTYNASPEAVKSALETLYKIDSPQRIAILGNMNELGKISAEAHKSVGELCDPSKLNLVITLGPDANKYLAPSAEIRGCVAKKYDDPYSIGEYLQSFIQDGAVILAKGSQNKVFAEEAVKKILADPEDAAKLVRQSKYWLDIKEKEFKRT